MKTLTTFIVGTSLLVGSALAAQNSKPATSSGTPATPSASAQQNSKKKHHKHKKAVASKVAKPAANKNTTPVVPAVAPKK